MMMNEVTGGTIVGIEDVTCTMTDDEDEDEVDYEDEDEEDYEEEDYEVRL